MHPNVMTASSRMIALFLAVAVSTITHAVAQTEGESLRVRTVIADLIPFDVQLAITSEKDEVSTLTLGDIVNDWMNDSFLVKAKNQVPPQENEFQAVALDKLIVSRRNLRGLQDSSDAKLYTASFTGSTLWNRYGDAEPVDSEVVELIQRATFLEEAQLLTMLQSAPVVTGLGPAVIDVRAFITPAGGSDNSRSDSSNSNNDELELIIIVAIIVACLAFALLLFAVLWAYRSDKRRQEAFTAARARNAIRDGNGSNNKTSAGTQSESDEIEGRGIRKSKSVIKKNRSPPAMDDTTSDAPPREIPSSSDYPESVISEDVSTSLTAYYNQSLGMQQNRQPHRNATPENTPNDAASMVSMDSYGYSLDGYAPSLSGGPTQMGYPVDPVNGQVKQPEALNADELKDLQDAVDNIMASEDMLRSPN